MSELLTLYSYWRSSAAYRVRIALNLKQVRYALNPVHLLNQGGEQRLPEFREVNPQGLIPVLVDGERVIRQSLAIMEYLDDTIPERPLLPTAARDRARVRSLSLLIACDVHPLNNLRVLQYLENELQIDSARREAWVRHWIHEGLHAFEQMVADHPSTSTYCEGEVPGMADCCLIPQMYNARRFHMDIAQYPTLQRIEAACLALPEFQQAAPEHQEDAPR